MTINILNIQKITQRFYTTKEERENYCTTKIKVKELQYNDKEDEIYYKISYKHKLSNKNPNTHLAHPFYRIWRINREKS